MAQINLKGIVKKFDNNVTVIKDLDLTVIDGEFLVLVGPSGCGKSTTLRMIAGLENCNDGEIIIDGKLVNNILPKDRDIAMVFQNYALYPHMTVYENMAFGLKLRKYEKAEIAQRVKEAADILEIEDLLQRKPKQLSGGQRQRVALGRAIVRKPKVFLFDEPLSNLDAKLRVQMRTEIKKLHQQLGITMIYVTHDQVEAMTMGNRIAVMKDGEIHQLDTPMNIYKKPADIFVASFIGSPAMNFLQVTKKSDDLINEKIGLKIMAPFEIQALQEDNILIGIRPEDFHLSQNSHNDVLIQSNIELIEPLGSESILYTKTGDYSLTSVITEFDPGVLTDNKIELYCDLKKIHLFNPKTTKRIPL